MLKIYWLTNGKEATTELCIEVGEDKNRYWAHETGFQHVAYCCGDLIFEIGTCSCDGETAVDSYIIVTTVQELFAGQHFDAFTGVLLAGFVEAQHDVLQEWWANFWDGEPDMAKWVEASEQAQEIKGITAELNHLLQAEIDFYHLSTSVDVCGPQQASSV